MKNTSQKKKILIIQIRPQKNISRHDFQCYKKIFASRAINLKRINLCYQNFDIDWAISNFNGIIISGSSYSVKDKFPQKEKIYRFIRRVIKEEKPLLGVCFGFQLLVEAAGGKIIHDKKNQEFGSFTIYLTGVGRKDLLFHRLDKKNIFQEGHEWRAAKLSKEIAVLAKGNKTPYQAIKIKHIPVYGVQFHPEMNKKDVIERMKLYSQTSDYNDFTWNLIRNTKSSLAGKKLLLNFVRYIVRY
jgi:GMP synthase (glutamine-hydrolysing)